MPCRDHGISLRDFLAGLFRCPLGGLLIHRGKYSPRPLRSLPLRIPARFSRRLFPWSLGGLLIHRGKDSPRPLRSLTLRIPARNSRRLFPWSLGEFLFIGERLPVYGVSPCLISMQKRKSVLLLRPCLDDLRAGRNIVGQPDVASDDAVVADSDPSQDRCV